jgi:hypothetical protein
MEIIPLSYFAPEAERRAPDLLVHRLDHRTLPAPIIRPHLIFFVSRFNTIPLSTACNYVRASPHVKRSTVDAVGDGVAITALCREACL